MYTEDDVVAFRQREGAKPVIVDTEVLLLLLIGIYDSSIIARCKMTASYTREDHSLLLRILHYFKPQILITPHILAEFSNQSRQGISGDKEAEYLGVIVEKLKNYQEEYISLTALLKVGIKLLSDLGFPDVSTLEAARNQGAVILTADKPLAARAMYLKLPACDFKAVIGNDRARRAKQ